MMWSQIDAFQTEIGCKIVVCTFFLFAEKFNQK